MLRGGSVPEMEEQKDGRFWPASLRDTRSPRMAEIHFPIHCYLASDSVLRVARKQNTEQVRASRGGKESGNMWEGISARKDNLPELKTRDESRKREWTDEREEIKERCTNHQPPLPHAASIQFLGLGAGAFLCRPSALSLWPLPYPPFSPISNWKLDCHGVGHPSAVGRESSGNLCLQPGHSSNGKQHMVQFHKRTSSRTPQSPSHVA